MVYKLVRYISPTEKDIRYVETNEQLPCNIFLDDFKYYVVSICKDTMPCVTTIKEKSQGSYKTVVTERSLTLSLKEARELYNSRIAFEHDLACLLFTEEELTPDLDEIYPNVQEAMNKYKEIADKLVKLQLLADYFNKDWKKTELNKGYFVKSFNPLDIGSHNSVVYPGIVYFKNPEHIKQALQIINKEPHDTKL